MLDFLSFASMPLRWALGKAWNVLRGFDADAEYQQVMDDLYAEQRRQGEGR